MAADVLSRNSPPPSACECTDLPLFYCTGSGPSSPVRYRLIPRLLANSDPFPCQFTFARVQLLGHVMVTCRAFQSPTCFLLMQQHLQEVMGQVEVGVSRDEVKREVEGCVQWLWCLETYVHRFISGISSVAATQTAKEIVTRLTQLVSSLNSVETALSIFRQHRLLQACSPPLTHLLMHVHWTALSVCYRLAPKLGLPCLLEQADQTISVLLISASVYWTSLSLKPEGEEVLESRRLWPCVCVRDLWLLLRCTLDQLPTPAGAGKTFWTITSSVLQNTILTSSSSSSTLGSNVVFLWWCIAQLATLYSYTAEGDPTTFQDESSHIISHWPSTDFLLPLTFRNLSEQQLRLCLVQCVCLYVLWGAAITPVASAWDYMYRHIDDVSTMAVQSTLPDWSPPEGPSPRQWSLSLLSLLRWTSSLPSGQPALTALAQHSSFELFLCLIAIATKDSDNDRSRGMWRQLKGRFYSRLHRRWLAERRGPALYRVLSLLLTLAWARGGKEVALKTVSLLTPLGLNNIQEHSPLMWKAVLAQLQLLIEKGENVEEVICRLKPLLASLARPRPPGSSEASLQWRTLEAVLDGAQQLLESSQGLELGAGFLIGPHLSVQLTSASGGELSCLLRHVESLCSVLTAIPSSSSLSLSSACCLLWEHCRQPLLFLTAHTLTPATTRTLTSTLAAITAFACQYTTLLSSNPSPPHPSPAQCILLDVAKGTVNIQVAVGYLFQVLASDFLRQNLLDSDAYQLLVLRVWLRALASSSSSSSSPAHQLTLQLRELPLVAMLLGDQDPPTEPLAMLRKLLVAMETAHMREEAGGGEVGSGVWRRRLNILLENLLQLLEPALSGSLGPGTVRQAYRLSAAVVASAPRLSYSKTDSRCLLPQLVDRLLFPLPSQRPLPQGTTAAIRSQLHHFLSGLLQLEPRRDDFVRRKLKQIFSHYFLQYTQQQPSVLMPAQPNPFLVAVQPWTIPHLPAVSSDQLVLVMEIVSVQCLTEPQQSASLSPALQYILDVVSEVCSPAVLASLSPALLPPLASCFLTCSTHTHTSFLRSNVMEILRILLGACREQQDVLPCSALLPNLTHCLKAKLTSCQAGVVELLLEVCELYPELVQQLLPMLWVKVGDWQREGKGEPVEEACGSSWAAFSTVQARLATISGPLPHNSSSC